MAARTVSELSRRSLLQLGLGGLLVPPLGLAGAARDPRFDDPAFNVRAFTRIAADLAPGRTSVVHYRGRAFGMVPGRNSVPLYGIDGAASLRAELQDDGSVRMRFNEFALYTDSETGAPLDSWLNPVTGERVPVWHQRNGPVNFELRPFPEGRTGKFEDIDARVGFSLPWVVEGEDVSFSQDVRSSRPNPIDARRFPAHFTGPVLHISEHSQYRVRLGALLDEARSSVEFTAALQSLKPWHPWMQFGSMGGRVFTRLVSSKVSSLEALDPRTVSYARDHLGPWTRAPAQWTGDYYDAYALYARALEAGSEPRPLPPETDRKET